MKTYIWTHHLSTEQWKKLRRQGLGGSDAAAVMNEHPYRTQLEVYLEKIGEEPPLVDNERMEWGKRLKQAVADQFTNATGLRTFRRHAVIVNKEKPFLIANIDRVIYGQNAGLLCKTTNEFMRHAWHDGVPRHIEIQCQHYMAVTGASKWWVAVLIGGNKFRHFCVNRDESAIKQWVGQAERFWTQHVLKRIPPPVDDSESSSKLLSRMYPLAEDGPPLRLPEEARSWIHKYREADQFIRLATKRKQEAENHIKSMMGIHELGRSGPYTVEWKNIERTNAAPYRRFSIRKQSNDEG